MKGIQIKKAAIFFKDKNNQVQNYIWSVKINVTGHCGDQNDSYSFLKILPTEFKNSKKSYKLFKQCISKYYVSILLSKDEKLRCSWICF